MCFGRQSGDKKSIAHESVEEMKVEKNDKTGNKNRDNFNDGNMARVQLNRFDDIFV